MVARWFRKDPVQSQAETLFEALNAAARRPPFFVEGAAPDTIDGRFELLAVHIYLAIRRLRVDAPASDRLSIALQEAFFRRLDHALRELGVGDLSVGRKIRGLAEAFYGRAGAYEKAIVASGSDLAIALARNVYESDDPDRAGLLANYVVQSDRILAATPSESLVDGVGKLAPLCDSIFARAEDERHS